MRRRTYLTADEWRHRLDECMARVLADPANFPEVTVWWARFRRAWLAERGELDTPPSTTGSRCTEPAVRGAEQGNLF
jgi:hypothetical protein